MVTPGGFERFFKEIGEPAADPSRPPLQDGPPDLGAVVAVARKHHCEIPLG
jgi:hypothetical protein